MKPNTIACRVPIGWQFITIEMEGSQINVGWESDWGSDYTISPGVSIELAAPNSPALLLGAKNVKLRSLHGPQFQGKAEQRT